MDLDAFATRFGPDIRARIDWARLAGVPTEVRVEASLEGAAQQRLAGMFTVWYADSAGRNCEWSAPGSRPLSVRGARRTLPTWPQERRRTVAALMRAFAAAPEPVTLTLPAYQVREGRSVLLDGNHRAVAAHQAGVEVRLTVCSLIGPVCESVLPDLRHYATPFS